MDDQPNMGVLGVPFACQEGDGVTEEQRGLVVRDPAICHGQAVLRGTRIMVSVVLDALADGMTEAEIIAEYPTLTVDGIRAAVAYAADLARDEYPAVTAS